MVVVLLEHLSQFQFPFGLGGILMMLRFYWESKALLPYVVLSNDFGGGCPSGACLSIGRVTGGCRLSEHERAFRLITEPPSPSQSPLPSPS